MDKQTITSRDICERLSERVGSLVPAAFEFSPGEFKALYRNRVQDFPGGFRRIDLVPRTLIARRVAKESGTDPDVALTLLRNWFGAKQRLHDITAGALQSLGYQVHEPDFVGDKMSYQILAPEHIHSERNASYFSPGSDVPEIDRLDLTLMAALLGWFPDKGEEPEENTPG